MGHKQLCRAYGVHRDASKQLGDGPSAKLLLFYSVECGLKAEILRRRSLRDTSQLDLRDHDLRKLAKELRLPPALCKGFKEHYQQQKENSKAVAPHELHEAWRYGAVLRDHDDAEAVATLRRLDAWCAETLGV